MMIYHAWKPGQPGRFDLVLKILHLSGYAAFALQEKTLITEGWRIRHK